MPIVDTRNTQLAIAHQLILNHDHCFYSMGAYRWHWHQFAHVTFPLVTDCSGACAAIAYWGGGNDPSGVNFAFGDTETVLTHAKQQRLILPKRNALQGDWVLFGPGPKPVHQVMLLQPAKVGNPLCFSHGRPGDPNAVPLNVLMGLGTPTFVRNVTDVRR